MDSWLWILLAIIAGLLLTGIAAWWLLRRFARPPKALVQRLELLSWRERLDLAMGLMRDPRLPLGIRLLIPAVVLYLVLPLDIIPDFIPFIGALDDVLIVLLALRLILRSMPEDVLDEHLSRYERPRPSLPSSDVPRLSS